MVGNLVILGDSYSTFEGYVPADSQIWYGNTPKPETDVCHVEETWWHQFVNETGATLVRNQSASGSAIAYSGRGGYLPNYSYIGRFEQLINSGFLKETQVDTFIVFGGTNDSWIDTPLGERKIAENDEEKREVLPAICFLFDLIKKTLPDTQVVVLINDVLKDEISDTLEAAALDNGFWPLRLKEISKQFGHPDIKGMRQIKDQLIAFLEEKQNG